MAGPAFISEAEPRECDISVDVLRTCASLMCQSIASVKCASILVRTELQSGSSAEHSNLAPMTSAEATLHFELTAVLDAPIESAKKVHRGPPRGTRALGMTRITIFFVFGRMCVSSSPPSTQPW